MNTPDTEREALEDALYDALDVVHDRAWHVHSAECCWPFPGAIASLGAFVAARESAAVEAKLTAVEAIAVDMDRRANIRSSAYVRAKDVANAIRHALENQ